jgi:hypothetical protein
MADNLTAIPTWILQIMTLAADVNQTDVPDYNFDAPSWWMEHIVRAGKLPLNHHPHPKEEDRDAFAADALSRAVQASGYLDRNGAAGYLAMFDLFMIAFESDYFNAWEILERHLERQRTKDASEA